MSALKSPFEELNEIFDDMWCGPGMLGVGRAGL